MVMRTEQVIAEALERTENDRYKLSVLVFARVKELGAGAQPLLNYPEDYLKRMELCDIALQEIADGKVTLANNLSI